MKVLSLLFDKIIIGNFSPFSRIFLCLVEVAAICYPSEAGSRENTKALHIQQVGSESSNSQFFSAFSFFFSSFSSLFLYLLIFLKDGVLFHSPGWPGTHSGAQASFKLEEILLSQPPMSSAFN